ncbi:MAG: DinB family protein [Bryobacteraceae bacterium]
MSEVLTSRAAAPPIRARALADSLRVFAGVRSGTLRLVSGLTSEQANFSPRRETWSVAQNLDHLLLTESLYRGQMSRLLELAREGRQTNIDVSLGDVDLNLPFIPKAMMPLMTLPLTMMNMFVPPIVRETVLRFPIMKAKNPKISEPAAAKPIATLREELTTSLAETESLFSGELPASAERVTVSHPVFGCNTIANLFGLMAAHEERHGTQIRELVRQPGFPASGRL